VGDSHSKHIYLLNPLNNLSSNRAADPKTPATLGPENIMSLIEQVLGEINRTNAQPERQVAGANAHTEEIKRDESKLASFGGIAAARATGVSFVE
jgi:hypothetical protein